MDMHVHVFHNNALLAVSQSTALMLLALAQDNSLTSVGLPPAMCVSIARAMAFFIISNMDWEYQQHVTFITLLWCVSHPVVGFP